MLEGIKRWFTSGASGRAQAFEALGNWAQGRQYRVHSSLDSQVFQLEGQTGTVPWRLEWGDSQRPYVPGQELRIRAEVSTSSELQVVVLNRALQESIEKAVFDQYVEGVQTRMDKQTPPEMRWLVMFQKLSGSDLGPLRERFAAVGSSRPWLIHWLAGPLSQRLLALPTDATVPFVLMIGRGRLTLRIQLAQPDPLDFEPVLKVFETALAEVSRANAEMAQAPHPRAPRGS